eukprot:scaffold33382_cov34-Attheya_sp.AAC.1
MVCLQKIIEFRTYMLFHGIGTSVHSSDSRVYNDIHNAQCEIDNHADTIRLGANCMPTIYFTGELCDVAPHTDKCKLQKDVPVAQAATAFTDLTTGETIIFILNQGLWFGAELQNTLRNPNQIRNFGHPFCDDPFDPN